MRGSLGQLILFRAREFYREPAILFWAFVFPVLMMVVLGVAFRPAPPGPVAVLVADEALAARLRTSKDLDVRLRSGEDAGRALDRGEAALLVLPGPVYRYDPAHPEARTTKLLVDAALRGGEPVAREDTVPARGSRYIDWFVPGLLGMQIMNGCLWGVGFALVEMRSKRLLKRFAVTPMRRWQFLVATAFHRFLVVAVEAVILLAIAGLAFDVRVGGSLLAFFVLASFGNFAFACIALLVAARPRNPEVAAGIMNIPMLPQMVLSGVFFSSARFPEWLGPFIKALPLTALNDALRRIANEGAGLEGVLRELAVLAGWAAVTLVIALRAFRWS